jgi:hypothetical protein
MASLRRQLSFRERPNLQRQVYALTVLTPVVPGHEAELRTHLRSLREIADDPLAASRTTHVGRWLVIDRLNYEGPPRRAPELARQYLLFSSIFDFSRERSVEAYLQGLCVDLREHVDAIWGHCEGCPDARVTDRAAAVARWLREHQVNTGFLFAPYGGATVGQVRRSLGLRQDLQDFVADHAGDGPRELQAAFSEAFARPCAR